MACVCGLITSRDDTPPVDMPTTRLLIPRSIYRRWTEPAHCREITPEWGRAKRSSIFANNFIRGPVLSHPLPLATARLPLPLPARANTALFRTLCQCDTIQLCSHTALPNDQKPRQRSTAFCHRRLFTNYHTDSPIHVKQHASALPRRNSRHDFNPLQNKVPIFTKFPSSYSYSYTALHLGTYRTSFSTSLICRRDVEAGCARRPPVSSTSARRDLLL